MHVESGCSARSGPRREARVLRDATSVSMTAGLQHMPERVGMILAQSHPVIRPLERFAHRDQETEPGNHSSKKTRAA